MRRIQLNTTLPKEDLDYIREHSMTKTLKEMGLRLNCSPGKVANNARIAGIQLPTRNQFGINGKPKMEEGEFFNVNQYDNWLTGLTGYTES